jgi:hypothetical protein
MLLIKTECTEHCIDRRVFTEVTFWHSAEYGIIDRSDFNSAEFRIILRNSDQLNSAEFRGISLKSVFFLYTEFRTLQREIHT